MSFASARALALWCLHMVQCRAVQHKTHVALYLTWAREYGAKARHFWALANIEQKGAQAATPVMAA